MERGRILILGPNKETTYEIRNLIDNKRFELEIALTREVGEQVLQNRRMSLIMIHSEMLRDQDEEFFGFLDTRAISVPVFVMGDEAERYQRSRHDGAEVRCFVKPYVPSDVISSIDDL